MKNFKSVIAAVLFFTLGCIASAYFVSNVEANKRIIRQKLEERRSQKGKKSMLEVDLKEVEYDLSGLKGVDFFHCFCES